MKPEPAKLSLENCRSYIDCHLKRLEGPVDRRLHLPHSPVITISRQAGAGGVIVGEKLAEYLCQHDPRKACPWTVFDKNLVTKVLEDHRISQQIAEYMPEDRQSEIRDAIEELLGLHPSSWTLAEKTAQTILHLAELGNTIIVGRGANVLIGHVPHAFHVRLVGSVEQRQKNLQEFNHLSAAEALAYLRRTDLGRKRYLKRHFDKDIDDPLLYHAVLNTDWLSATQVTTLMGEAVLRWIAVTHPA